MIGGSTEGRMNYEVRKKKGADGEYGMKAAKKGVLCQGEAGKAILQELRIALAGGS